MPRGRATCSAHRPATTWRWCASRTARSPGRASATRTVSTGTAFLGCCVTRRRANAARSCCRGSSRRSRHPCARPGGDATGAMPEMARGNGERGRDAYGLDWEGFSRVLRDTPPGNRGAIMLPWFEPEVTPPVRTPGVRRYGLDAGDAAGNVRAVIEAQMLATARHAGWMGERVVAIHATGGAAQNRAILQVMADVHGAEVQQLAVGESAALGAALRAFHGDQVAQGRQIGWEEVVRGFVEPVARVHPDPRGVAVYARLKQVYAACEAHALGRGPDPTPLIEAFRSARRPA